MRYRTSLREQSDNCSEIESVQSHNCVLQPMLRLTQSLTKADVEVEPAAKQLEADVVSLVTGSIENDALGGVSLHSKAQHVGGGEERVRLVRVKRYTRYSVKVSRHTLCEESRSPQ